MAGKRDIFAQLSRDDLLGLVDAYGLEVPDRRVKTLFVDLLVPTDEVDLKEVLSAIPRAGRRTSVRGLAWVNVASRRPKIDSLTEP